MRLVRSGLWVGVVIWAAATATFVPLGRFVFGPDNHVPVAFAAGLVVLATFVGIYSLAVRILRSDAAPSLERGALLGVFACLPGLVLDAGLYALNGGRYPGLDGEASGAMTCALLLAYAAALLGTLGAARTLANGPDAGARRTWTE